jgi:viroplasmin and RNaseH domain-containing protein
MRSYKSFNSKEKAEMYCAAQNKCCDDKIMAAYNCNENTLIKCLSDVFLSLQKQRGFTGLKRYP